MVICVNRKIAHCVRSSNRVIADVLNANKCVLNTDVQPYLITKIFLPALRMKKVRNEHNLNLYSATENLMILLNLINLFIKLGNVCTPTAFNVVKT